MNAGKARVFPVAPVSVWICLDESLREAFMEPDVTDGEGLSFRAATT